jgi:hypothetical protein
MKPLPNGNRIVVVRRPRTLQVHVSIMARERPRANCPDQLVETDFRALFVPGPTDNGLGRSPRVLDEIRVDDTRPRSVIVPGAVRAWAALAGRFGRLGLDRALSRAAERAARGVACTPRSRSFMPPSCPQLRRSRSFTPSVTPPDQWIPRTRDGRIAA